MEWPNLDCMDAADLADFAKKASMMSEYATLKWRAAKARLRGDTLSAMETENLCEQLYEKLPQDVRW